MQIPIALCYDPTVTLNAQDEHFPRKVASPLSTVSDGMWFPKALTGEREAAQIR